MGKCECCQNEDGYYSVKTLTELMGEHFDLGFNVNFGEKPTISGLLVIGDTRFTSRTLEISYCPICGRNLSQQTDTRE